MHGREISSFVVSVNSKGFYEVTAKIDGLRHRRFVRPNMSLYSYLGDKDIYQLRADEKIQIVKSLFPPE